MERLISLLLLIVLPVSPDGIKDEVIDPFLLDCRVPENVSNIPSRVNLTEEERQQLQFEGRCFLLCATVQLSNEVKRVLATIPKQQ